MCDSVVFLCDPVTVLYVNAFMCYSKFFYVTVNDFMYASVVSTVTESKFNV